MIKTQDTKVNITKSQEHILDQARVIEQFSMDWTNKELARISGIEINRVTPRVLELRKMNLITESQRRPCKCKPNNKAIAWRLK